MCIGNQNKYPHLIRNLILRPNNIKIMDLRPRLVNILPKMAFSGGIRHKSTLKSTENGEMRHFWQDLTRLPAPERVMNPGKVVESGGKWCKMVRSEEMWKFVISGGIRPDLPLRNACGNPGKMAESGGKWPKNDGKWRK